MDHWIWYRKLLWSPIRLSKRKLTSCYALHVPRFLLIVAFITLFSFVVFNIPRSSWMNQIILPPFIHPFIHDERGVNEWTNERKNEWTMKEGERHPLLKKRYWPGGITPGEEPTKRGGGNLWTLDPLDLLKIRFPIFTSWNETCNACSRCAECSVMNCSAAVGDDSMNVKQTFLLISNLVHETEDGRADSVRVLVQKYCSIIHSMQCILIFLLGQWDLMR